MSFKEHYLQEKNLHNNPMRFIFDAYKTWLPISPKIFDNITTQKDVTAFHITSPDNLKSLAKLQGKKKTISALTGLSDTWPLIEDRGIASGRGLAKLKGDLVIKFTGDIFSSPDSSGRRWIPTDFPVRNDYISDKILDIKKRIVEKYFRIPKGLSPIQKRDPKWKKFKDYKYIHERSSYEDIKKLPDVDGKMKANIIRDYYVQTTILIKSDKKVKEFLNNYVKPSDSDEDYDEVLMNNFKIEKFWFIKSDLPIEEMVTPIHTEQQIADKQKELENEKELMKKVGIKDYEYAYTEKYHEIGLKNMINKEGGK